MESENNSVSESSGNAMKRFFLVTLNDGWAASKSLGSKLKIAKAVLRGRIVKI
jgi:hypothetical protein